MEIIQTQFILAMNTLDELADEINHEHQQCVDATSGIIQHAIRVGELLIEAKTKCKHGEFLDWITANCKFSIRTADYYIKIANNREKLLSNSQCIANLNDAIRLLAKPKQLHISDDSYEWYTPQEYIEAARGVMGSIDLDPATSEFAQKNIQAGHFYTQEDDGLKQSWYGNVWLNPPYNMPLIEQFIDKTLEEYEAGNIQSAIVLTNNSTDTGWFHKLIDYPVCFTRGRIKFYTEGDNLATRQGQSIFYLGDNPDLFSKVFSVFGVVLKKYDNQQS